MELRRELTPPLLDTALVARLATLASYLDGARPGEGESELAEFNRLAGTSIPRDEFQGISGGEEHEDYVRRVLYRARIRPVRDVSRAELVEVVRRAKHADRYEDREAYRAVFDANARLPNASSLIDFPPDYDSGTNTWGGDRPIAEYDPTPEQIVEWAWNP